jgi:hypothetical protein
MIDLYYRSNDNFTNTIYFFPINFYVDTFFIHSWCLHSCLHQNHHYEDFFIKDYHLFHSNPHSPNNSPLFNHSAVRSYSKLLQL